MAELSSNWKKLQAKLKAEAASQSSKRKSDSLQQGQPRAKRLKASPIRKTKAEPGILNRQMGGVHSSIPKNEREYGHSPSLAVWAEENDISAEVIAEAYDLGLKNPSAFLSSDKDKINHGLTEGLEIGKYVAIDCEMVGVGDSGYESVLARLSMVDFHGRQVYDSYVKPQEPVTDWRTEVSGIKLRDMRFARDFEEVQLQAHQVLQDRVLVGHDVKHDLDVLRLSHPPRDTRDTAKYNGFRKFGNGRKPALRNVAQNVLGVEIHSGMHSSLEDARVAMLLFRKHKSGFDMEHANRFTPKTLLTKGTSQKAKKKKKKNKARP